MIYFVLFLILGASVALIFFPQLSKISKSSLSNPTKKAVPTFTIQSAKIYLIVPNDNGNLGKKIGCGDSVVAFALPPHPNTTDKSNIEQAYMELVSVKPEAYKNSGLINALENSSLALEKAEIIRDTVTVKLSGKVSLAGICDSPRFKAQLEEVALQFPEVKQVKILINGQDIDSLLSGKGI